jgi:hypothetical protein
MIIEATVEAGGGRVELYSWTAYPDEDDDADVAILKAQFALARHDTLSGQWADML